jgi:glycosyltransferase involved in cell wall biosynthesis
MKIVIFTHSLSRTGASVALLDHIINDLSHEYRQIILVTLNGGELLQDYKAVCYRLINLSTQAIGSKLLRKLLPNYFLSLLFRFTLNINYSDPILINTLVPLQLAKNVNLSKYRIFVWAHELSQTASLYCQPDWHLSIPTAKYIAASEPVLNYLAAKGLDVCCGVVMPVSLSSLDRSGIPVQKRNCVLGVGGPSWSKGTDYFLQVARKCDGHNDIEFVWIGGSIESFEHKAFQRDAERLNLRNVMFVPSTNDMKTWYRCAKGVLVLSRDESFGLPIVEAGIYGVPTIAWRGEDGPSWIISNTNGFTAAYGDVDEVCKLLTSLDEISHDSCYQQGLHAKVIDFVRTGKKLSECIG